MEEHFDGELSGDDRSPDGFMEVAGITAVLVEPNTGRLVLTGKPSEHHNCDRRGCGSLEHKIGEFDINKSTLEPVRVHIKER